MMTRKILCLLAALLLASALFSAASADSGPVTVSELDEFLIVMRERVADLEPLNNPAADDAQSEDGIRFQYEPAVFFAEGTVLEAATPVNALLFADSEGPVFRGVGIDTMAEDLLAVCPQENELLTGTREDAVLYLRSTEGAGFVYGRALRDGQRLTAVEYGEVLPSGTGFRRAAVTFTLQNSLVTSIRLDGLNPSSAVLDAAGATELFNTLSALSGVSEYSAVKISRNGMELTPFGPEDLTFSGISYSKITPENLPGSPERELIDNLDGTWLLRADGDGYEAVFSCDAEGNNARILSFSILSDELEGPRAVRLGDLFSEDFCRFRSGENEMAEDMTEWLYGAEGVVPRGFASYDPSDGETSLRYVTKALDGTEVELLLKYAENTLIELILHTL